MRKDPETLKKEQKDKEVMKRAQEKSIVKMADIFDLLWQDKNFQPLKVILESSLKVEEHGLNLLKDSSVEEILKIGKDRYMCKRAEFEKGIGQLNNILGVQGKYRLEADRILGKPSTSSSRDAKKREAGG